MERTHLMLLRAKGMAFLSLGTTFSDYCWPMAHFPSNDHRYETGKEAETQAIS